MPSDERPLPHERLDAFQVALELITFTNDLRPAVGAGDLVDQLKRASTSIALNVAEGTGKQGRDRLQYYQIARGSALESAAALTVLHRQQLLSDEEYLRGRKLCERLYAMLTRMIR
jgi:four helix bundle protein